MIETTTTHFGENLQKLKREEKKAYFRDLIKNANAHKNFKKTWQSINKVLNNGRKKLICPTNVCIDLNTQEKTQCRKAIANLLNSHFTSIGEKLASKLHQNISDHESFMGPKCQNSIFLSDITLDEIIDEINAICVNKGMGYDNIPPKIIKWAPHLFSPVLLSIFNKCLHLGYFFFIFFLICAPKTQQCIHELVYIFDADVLDQVLHFI